MRHIFRKFWIRVQNIDLWSFHCICFFTKSKEFAILFFYQRRHIVLSSDIRKIWLPRNYRDTLLQIERNVRTHTRTLFQPTFLFDETNSKIVQKSLKCEVFFLEVLLAFKDRRVTLMVREKDKKTVIGKRIFISKQ